MPGHLESIRVCAPAKVNLALGVGGVRPDGYHELVTIFQAVSLFDTVTVSANKPGVGITVSVQGRDAKHVPTDKRNLAWQAAELVAAEAEISADVHIAIHKEIPVAGGMAGGSADAAGTLVACEQLWRANLSKEHLNDLAARLGSDVAFALHGGTAVGTGRGERITPAMARGNYQWVFALADRGLSTPKVYAECDRLRLGRRHSEPMVPADLMEALLTGDAVKLGRALHNDLQAAAVSLRPELDLVLDLGRDLALGAIVSGSGPTVAFLVADEETALDLTVSLAASGFTKDAVRAHGPVPGVRMLDAAAAP